MKILFTTIFIVICFLADAQVNIIETFERDSTGKIAASNKRIEITAANCNEFCRRADELIRTANHDSLRYAYNITKRLFDFDSATFTRGFMEGSMRRIKELNYKYYSENIIGTWNFAWSGSNLGTDGTSASKKEKIFFTATEAFFYVSDSLKKKMPYLIANNPDRFYTPELNFQLYFPESKTFWYISFHDQGVDYDAKLKFSSQHIGLFINKMPNCLSGCSESIYVKTVGAECETDYLIDGLSK